MEECTCVLKLDGWFLRTRSALAEPLFPWVAASLLSVLSLSQSSLTGLRSNLDLMLQPLSLLPLMCIFSPSFTPAFYELLAYLFSPSGLCLLELQLKLGDIISNNQQNVVHNTSPPPCLPYRYPLRPPHTNPHLGRGQRNTSSVSEKPLFVLPSALVGSLSSSDRGERTNRHRGKEALMRAKTRSWSSVRVMKWRECIGKSRESEGRIHRSKQRRVKDKGEEVQRWFEGGQTSFSCANI